MHVKTIRIVKGSSPDREGLLPKRITELEAAGFKILYDDLLPDPRWPYCAASVEDRMKAVINAFVEPESDAVMWARGGYGASELLPYMPWSEIRRLKPKVLIGFSDVCAVHSALYVMTGQTSIHGPMPATVTWKQNSTQDVDQLIALLKGDESSGSMNTVVVPGACGDVPPVIEGILFGGSLTVLTGLIGTPYLPTSFKDHILLFEDITENPGRVMRALNQWQQSGRFAGIKAIVLGAFTGLGGNLPDNAPMLQEEIARRFAVPVFKTTEFGHVSPNMPYVVGSQARLTQTHLHWSLSRSPITLS